MRFRALFLAALLAALAAQAPTSAKPPADPGEGRRHHPHAAHAVAFDGHFRSWIGEASGVAGETTYDAREFIVVDAPFDDHGADVDRLTGQELEPFARGETSCLQSSPPLPLATLPPVSLCSLPQGIHAAGTSVGDFRYPDEPAFVRNAADIVETRVAVDATATYLLVALNAVVDASRTAIEARFDEHVVLVHGQTALVDGVPVEGVTDADANIVEVRIPHSVMDLGTGVHSVFAAAGIWDTATNDWFRPADNVSPYFDLAYVPGEGFDSYWRESKQAQDIAITHFAVDAAQVDFTRLLDDSCSTDPCIGIEPHASGLTTRVFRSSQLPGQEGVVPQTRYASALPPGGNVYRSPYQPYSLYDPFVEPAAPSPLVLLLHPLGGNHMTFPLTAMSGIRAWADETGALVAMPLARGETGWYEGEAEADVFEVWRDVARHYHIDENRVYIAGVGMGGFGAYRLGLLHPDRFARAIVWGGMTSPATISTGVGHAQVSLDEPSVCITRLADCRYDVSTLFGNAANLPYLIVHGALDTTTPITGPETWTKTLPQYRYVAYAATRDDTAYPATTIGHVLDWLRDLPERPTVPVHVRYSVRSDVVASTEPAHGVYWVGDVEPATGRSVGTIDAWAAIDPGATTGWSIGSDVLGPYLVRWQQANVASALPNYLSVQLDGVSGASIDVDRLGWDLEQPQTVVAIADTPAELRLTGDFAAPISVDGVPYHREGSSLVLELPAGASTVRIGSTT